MITITVDCRSRDHRAHQAPKYYDVAGNLTDYKPVAHIAVDPDLLSPLARWIAERLAGTYVGGFLHRPNDVVIYGPEGSLFAVTAARVGETRARERFLLSGLPMSARAKNPRWLWAVLEPEDHPEEYINGQAQKIADLGAGGYIEIRGERWPL